MEVTRASHIHWRDFSHMARPLQKKAGKCNLVVCQPKWRTDLGRQLVVPTIVMGRSASTLILNFPVSRTVK
jgi:hypothetical protein